MSQVRWQEPNLARAPFVNERPVRRLAVTLWVLFAIVGGLGVWQSQHFASGDHYPMYDREMQRVTVASSRRGGLFSNQPAPERR